jgi:hypothetical protein
MSEEEKGELITIILPSNYRIYVSKSEWAFIEKAQDGRMFIRMKNCESMEIKKEVKHE